MQMIQINVLRWVLTRPAEILLGVLTGNDLHADAHRTRYVSVGEMAGTPIQLSSATLRSEAVELYGVGGGSISKEDMQKVRTEILPQLFDLVVSGKLKIETEAVALKDVERACKQGETNGKRLVIVLQ
ncbi:hypothetical protein BH09BAC4_BH09BAC4_41130 [soil metagenome]